MICPQCGISHEGSRAEGCPLSSWLLWSPELGLWPEEAERIYGEELKSAIAQWADNSDREGGYWLSGKGDFEVCVQIPGSLQVSKLRVVADPSVDYAVERLRD